jgi:hypothetical protein
MKIIRKNAKIKALSHHKPIKGAQKFLRKMSKVSK